LKCILDNFMVKNVSILIIIAFIISQNALSQSVNAPVTKNIEANSSAIDPGDFSITWPNANDVILVSVSLSSITSGTTVSFPVTTNLTASYGYTDTWNNRTSMNFRGTPANVNAALASMTLTTGSIKTAININVTAMLYEAAYYYNPTNNHFYQFVSGAVNYATAKNGAAGSSYKGKTGYLVTITSQSEDNFVLNNVSGQNFWIAASDANSEGAWYLDAGQEANTNIWNTSVSGITNTTYTSYASTGNNASGQYSNWCNGEPNNADGAHNGEDYAVTKWGGGSCWNDLASENYSGIGGYVVEYNNDYPSGSDYTGFYSANVVYNGGKTYSISSGEFDNSSTWDNGFNINNGVIINPSHIVNIANSKSFYSGKVEFSGSGKIIFNSSGKWGPSFSPILQYDASSNTSYSPSSPGILNDITGISSNATLSTVGYNSGNNGYLYFDGAYSYADFTANLGAATVATVEIWAKVLNTSGMIFGFDTYDVWTNGGNLGFNCGYGILYGINSTAFSPSIGVWRHYVFVMNSGAANPTSNKIYINGSLQTLTYQAGSGWDGSTNAKFGTGIMRLSGWRTEGSYKIKMNVAMFKIYAGELTPAEINSNYQLQKSRFGL
jgi:hypothetical protein